MSSAETIRDLARAMRHACRLEKMPTESLSMLAAAPSGRKLIEQWQRAREGAF